MLVEIVVTEKKERVLVFNVESATDAVSTAVSMMERRQFTPEGEPHCVSVTEYSTRFDIDDITENAENSIFADSELEEE